MVKPALDIYRLSYCSRPTLTVARNIRFEVDQILEKSLGWNLSVGISGILVLTNGYFIQSLEGSEAEVRALFTRIESDRRHYDLRVLSDGFVDGRLFAEWAMCAATLSASDSVVVNHWWHRADFHPEKLTAESTEQMLVAVAALQRGLAGLA